MPTPVDLPAVLSDNSPEPFPATVPAYIYDSSTPAHRFTGVIGAIDKGARYVAVLARDFFDPELARALLEFANAWRKDWTVDDDIRIIEGFKHPGYGFDSVALLGPRVHELYSLDSEALNARSVLGVPIFRPEFVGDESADLLEVVRKDYVSTLDWKRKPSPRVNLRFNDTAAGYRSTGRKLGLEKPETATEIISKLTDAQGSFAEIQNYLGEVRKLIAEDGEFVVTTPEGGKEERVARKRIAAWMDEFLMKPPH